jgi:hypothetical protein
MSVLDPNDVDVPHSNHAPVGPVPALIAPCISAEDAVTDVASFVVTEKGGVWAAIIFVVKSTRNISSPNRKHPAFIAALLVVLI